MTKQSNKTVPCSWYFRRTADPSWFSLTPPPSISRRLRFPRLPLSSLTLGQQDHSAARGTETKLKLREIIIVTVDKLETMSCFYMRPTCLASWTPVVWATPRRLLFHRCPWDHPPLLHTLAAKTIKTFPTIKTNISPGLNQMNGSVWRCVSLTTLLLDPPVLHLFGPEQHLTH